MKSPFTTRRTYTRPGKINNASGDFMCQTCGVFVSVDVALSGVGNRNHCPYCLSSRHLDHFEAGDRLSACKGRMKPVALTFKRIAKKYVGYQSGELMIVHRCEGCGKISINRIAADDDAHLILAVLEQSAQLKPDLCDCLAQHGITPLSTDERDQVQYCLFGAEIAEVCDLCG